MWTVDFTSMDCGLRVLASKDCVNLLGVDCVDLLGVDCGLAKYGLWTLWTW